MNTAGAPDWLPTFFIPFLTLSHPVPRPDAPDSFPNANYYLPSFLDGCFLVTCIAVMAVLRDVFRLFVLEPFAHWFLTRKRRNGCDELKDPANGLLNSQVNGVAVNGNGHGGLYTPVGDIKGGRASPTPSEKSDLLRRQSREDRVVRRSVLRFAEQGWSVIYYTFQWSFGLYIHYNLPTAPFNPSNVWLGYPHIPLSGPLKLYYLIQTACYLHQILVLHAEARRKDHYQMLAHHIITVALMVLSYFYNFTRVGCLLMVLMDYCDIFLPLAKTFRYLSFSFLCDATFTWFLLSWFVTRHVLFILIIKSTYFDVPKLLPLSWNPDEGWYLTSDVLLGFSILMMALQVLQVAWFRMICLIAWRVVSGQGAEDSRSDDEDAGDSHLEDTPQNVIPANSGLKKRRR